jgi:hypothetical protein
MKEVLENIGAGEGNRTLVFSLEVVEFRSMLKGHSNILQPCGSLRPLRNFSLSEWRWVDLARGTAISQGSFPDLRIRGVGGD